MGILSGYSFEIGKLGTKTELGSKTDLKLVGWGLKPSTQGLLRTESLKAQLFVEALRSYGNPIGILIRNWRARD